VLCFVTLTFSSIIDISKSSLFLLLIWFIPSFEPKEPLFIVVGFAPFLLSPIVFMNYCKKIKKVIQREVVVLVRAYSHLVMIWYECRAFLRSRMMGRNCSEDFLFCWQEDGSSLGPGL